MMQNLQTVAVVEPMSVNVCQRLLSIRKDHRNLNHLHSRPLNCMNGLLRGFDHPRKGQLSLTFQAQASEDGARIANWNASNGLSLCYSGYYLCFLSLNFNLGMF